MEFEPVGLDSLDVALKNFVDTVHYNIANSIEAWRVLHKTYEKLSNGNGETAVSFTSWCLRKIDHGIIRTVSQMKHRAHFEALSTEAESRLSKIADAFKTCKWMVYFVLGEAMINNSPKAIRRILQVKHYSPDTLEEMLQKLEAARERRRGDNSRNSSNDLTKFTLSDVNSAYGPPPVRHHPAAPKKLNQGRLENANLLTPIRPRGNPTPPGTDSSSDSDYIRDVEQPRKAAASLPDDSFNWENISGIAQGGISQNACWLEGSPADSYDEISDYGGNLIDAAPASDSTEELRTMNQHPWKPTAEAPSVNPRRLQFNHREVQHKRQRTIERPANDTIEISPRMILEAIISTRELTWLGPLLQDFSLLHFQRPDPVDRKLWSLVQRCISPPTSNGCAIPIDIIKSMGFPSVEDVLKVLNCNPIPPIIYLLLSSNQTKHQMAKFIRSCGKKARNMRPAT